MFTDNDAKKHIHIYIHTYIHKINLVCFRYLFLYPLNTKAHKMGKLKVETGIALFIETNGDSQKGWPNTCNVFSKVC